MVTVLSEVDEAFETDPDKEDPVLLRVVEHEMQIVRQALARMTTQIVARYPIGLFDYPPEADRETIDNIKVVNRQLTLKHVLITQAARVAWAQHNYDALFTDDSDGGSAASK